MNMKLTIIGAGNIGGAVAKGLLAAGAIKEDDLAVVDVDLKKLDEYRKAYPGIQISTDAKEMAEKADIVILAVKPWLVEPVLSGIADVITQNKIFACIAAGIDFKFLNSILQPGVCSFRVMPNTAMLIGESMTLISSQNANSQQEQLILDLFNQLGKAVMIEEKMMGPATSVASCGIAYALRYLRAASEGAVELGFRADVAHEIVAQTMKGAAELILKNHSHPETEIDKVCTPGGWTIKGLNEMEAFGFSDAVIKGLKAND